MIPAGFGEIAVAHTGGGIVGEAIWTIGFDNNAGDTAAEIAETVATALDTLNYDAMISTAVTVTEVRVKLGPDDTGPSATHTLNLAGNIGGQAAPPNLAVLVHKNTPLGGRKGRGRLFVPGLAEAELDQDGLITSGTQSSFQSFFNSFGGGLALGSLPLMLLHTDATSPTAIETLSVDVKLATQRRRLRR